tara:strand:- start:309 stop:812 length:504 start_codon:yes stop_codon:yes gene_type:complete
MRDRYKLNEYNKQLKAATQLGWYVSKITKSFFNKQGFAQNHILENWDSIVGPFFVEKSLPIKLKIEKIGGYLVIACDGSTAIELEYLKEDIIEKINSYYGFQAINKIKFQNLPIQNDIKNRKSKKNPQDKFNLDDKNKQNSDYVSLSSFEKALLKLQKSIIKKKNDL